MYSSPYSNFNSGSQQTTQDSNSYSAKNSLNPQNSYDNFNNNAPAQMVNLNASSSRVPLPMLQTYSMILPQQTRHLLSCTLNAITSTDKLLKKLNLPFMVFSTPFKASDCIPVFMPKEAIRCNKCLCYISPYVSWLDKGSYKCCFCGYVRSLTGGSFALKQLSVEAEQIDGNFVDSFVATQYPFYEMIAPDAFCTSPPKNFAHVFVFDISEMLEFNYVTAFVETFIEKIHMNVASSIRSSVALICVDEFLHFFNYTNIIGEGEIQLLHYINPDRQACFPSELFFMKIHQLDKQQLRTLFIDQFVSIIKSKLSNNLNNLKKTPRHEIILETLTYAKNCLKANNSGGQIILLGDFSTLITDETLKSSSKLSQTFKKFAYESVVAGVCVDVFSFDKRWAAFDPSVSLEQANLTNDLLTTLNNEANPKSKEFVQNQILEHLTKYGRFYMAGRPGIFASQFAHYLSQAVAIDTALILRMSTGLSVESYFGNAHITGSGKLVLPYLRENDTFGFKLEYDDSLYIHNDGVYAQLTQFYTRDNGERRIRVLNIKLDVVSTTSNMYSRVDGPLAAVAMAKIAGAKCSEEAGDVSKERVTGTCHDIAKEFFKNEKLNFDGSSLWTAQSMQHFYMLAHGLLSESCFNGWPHQNYYVRQGHALKVLLHLSPLVFNLYAVFSSGGGDFNEVLNSHQLLPSSQYLERMGNHYVAFNGERTVVLVVKSGNLMCGGENNREYRPHEILWRDLPNSFTIDSVYAKTVLYDLNLFKQFVAWLGYVSQMEDTSGQVLFVKDESRYSSIFYKMLRVDRRGRLHCSYSEFLGEIKGALL